MRNQIKKVNSTAKVNVQLVLNKKTVNGLIKDKNKAIRKKQCLLPNILLETGFNYQIVSYPV
jgi:hypothetical protein